MTHNNLLCILSFHSWNLIFQLLIFFFLGNDSILRSEIRIFTPRRSAGDSSDAYWMYAGEVCTDKINTAFTGLQRRKNDLQAVLYREYKKYGIVL